MDIADPKLFQTICLAFLELKKVLYVYVKGFAVGMMCTLLSMADFVYATDNAFFFTPFMTSYQSPEGLSTIKFPEIMGPRRANEMLFLEKKMSAKEAA
mmetsp:Transcript_4098/g.3030  ORF Transcript_4098/g.3030 Transcript_4098/m.3030 type:complete len:98 (+) Transcript_4098:258-551(+)|eukprot:CAMPEP_0202963044 /NCGR_PEP_ID=MMETSP1396-20130829/7046_1 /ASSEMBLY_ACC=CAM_ASM_000872 /TAXON_ID= /ORGANISM="Pseudokeronopsis sp., Strain Brazil" /LENGTH=97 /DNA_ID=CAMNT_0049683961 /DNA_START=251 /DNA_END=544 /DNA_ORIENTATION=-